MPALQHSFKTLRRKWRSGELRLIAAALVVAVAAVTAVTRPTDRVRQAMVLRANTLLAADLALDSSFPIPEPYLEEARRLGLETAQTLSFRSMLVVGERMQLVEVKAVEGGLSPTRPAGRGRGPLRCPVPTDVVPEPGTAWPNAQLAQVLKRPPGRGSPWETRSWPSARCSCSSRTGWGDLPYRPEAAHERRGCPGWHYGLANIARCGAASVAQSVALGLGIMAILLLTVVRGDLLANWQARLP